MIDTNTIEAKLNQLNQIKRLCDAKQAGIRFDQVDSNNICLICFLLVGSLIVWVAPFPYSISGVVVAAFVFGFIIRPVLRKKLRTTDERIFASVYAYVSPLPDCQASKHNTYLTRSLKERDHENYICIKNWVRMESEAIEHIIYTRSKEGEMREMIIEKYKGDA